ncbi:hypothetical protein [Parafilimonas terrae]|uniref:Uncharacterized protein n=1 Tax=Parafilimonas terrae TaxID=1465490 RepID=A0A1I5YHE9_9BACT|nr:hypothetical protein [Parafilimonas terrae]SFQ43606.1 hypothetical protein SAMN05444277_11248 [Parafilimonas terrae]
MKKIFLQIFRIRLFVLPATALLLCSWENPCMYNYANRKMPETVNKTDTLPENNTKDFDKAIEALNENMAKLNKQMKEIKIDVDKEITRALSSIDFKAMEKQVKENIDKINWDKVQQDANVSIQKARAQIAKVDFTKMQKDMQALQEKFKREEFKSQFNGEKLQQQINDAMANAKISIEKAKVKLQQMKDFTDALAGDGLIDKKKGYNIEWKDGDLYINHQKQSKDVSDKYRKYESSGKIKMMPDDAEYF